MSKLEKLIQEILKLNKDLRFQELAKVLIRLGYTQCQPSKGSSHYIFRKNGCMPITIPKHKPVKRVYIELVRDIIMEYIDEERDLWKI